MRCCSQSWLEPARYNYYYNFMHMLYTRQRYHFHGCSRSPRSPRSPRTLTTDQTPQPSRQIQFILYLHWVSDTFRSCGSSLRLPFSSCSDYKTSVCRRSSAIDTWPSDVTAGGTSGWADSRWRSWRTSWGWLVVYFRFPDRRRRPHRCTWTGSERSGRRPGGFGRRRTRGRRWRGGRSPPLTGSSACRPSASCVPAPADRCWSSTVASGVGRTDGAIGWSRYWIWGGLSVGRGRARRSPGSPCIPHGSSCACRKAS